MAIVILVIGALLVVTALNNRLTPPSDPNLASLLYSEFVPPQGTAPFWVWILAILFIGLLGYSKTMKPISNAFLILLFVGIFLATKGGVFKNLTTAFQSISNTPEPTDPSQGSGNTSSQYSTQVLGSNTAMISPSADPISQLMQSIPGLSNLSAGLPDIGNIGQSFYNLISPSSIGSPSALPGLQISAALPSNIGGAGLFSGVSGPGL